MHDDDNMLEMDGDLDEEDLDLEDEELDDADLGGATPEDEEEETF